jgi:transcriptional regulator with XRE-family HTH domain
MSREMSKNEEAFEKLRNKIKMARLSMGLTQSDFAKKAGVASGSKLSKIETGLQKPDLRDLKKISNLANISLNELLEDSMESLMFSGVVGAVSLEGSLGRIEASAKSSELDSYNLLLIEKMTEILRYDGDDKEFLLKRYQTIESIERLHHSLSQAKSDQPKEDK